MPVKKDKDGHRYVEARRHLHDGDASTLRRRRRSRQLQFWFEVASMIAIAAAAVYGYRLSSRRAITATTVTD